MNNLLKVMADRRLDAIVHKAVEHQPTLIQGRRQPTLCRSKGAPHQHFLVYVPIDRRARRIYRDQLPAGITFLGRPYDDGKMIQH